MTQAIMLLVSDSWHNKVRIALLTVMTFAALC